MTNAPRDGTEDAADADGRTEEPGGGLVEAELLDHDDHGQDAEAAEHEPGDDIDEGEAGERGDGRARDRADLRFGVGVPTGGHAFPSGTTLVGEAHRMIDTNANEIAFRTKARVKPLSWMRIAATAGPMTNARLSSVDQALLAGPSSRSSRTSVGR